MVSIADAQVDLFGSELPSFDEVKKLWSFVNSSESNQLAFSEKVQSCDSPLAAGLGYLICGNTQHAVEQLEKGDNCAQKSLGLGYAYRSVGDYDKSIQAFDKAGSQGVDTLTLSMEKAQTYRQAGQFEQTENELKNCSNFEGASSEYHFQYGRLMDAIGDYEQAMDHYEKAVDLDGNHKKAIFQLAYSYDLRGDEEEALYYYKMLAKTSPVHVNALLNLAVLYEDMGEYEKALTCVESVLMSYPNHAKAALFNKDILSSKVMIYDEEKEKRRDRQNKILEIPISDFELSVRSRNCLRKMNIITLGDLLKTSEAELLSYKNFGETSLHEIKKILDSKNLRLGMALEEKNATPMIDPETVSGANKELLEKPVEELVLSVRARRALSRLGVKTIFELISKTEAELLGCKNFGVTSLNEIKERLTAFSLSLRKLE